MLSILDYHLQLHVISTNDYGFFQNTCNNTVVQVQI